MPASTVDAQIIDIINQAQTATMSATNVTTSGAGKAYQSVAQSSAIAVQDATDALRNIATIATSAAGVAMAQLLASPPPEQEKYLTVLKEAQTMMTQATNDYTAIGQAASAILQQFPHG